MTKQVRAKNVKVGDTLSLFDSKAFKERHMVVVSCDLSFPGVQQLTLRYPRGKVLYRWNMKQTDLVRVNRSEEK